MSLEIHRKEIDKAGVISRDRRMWRGVRKESISGSQSGKVEYGCGVKTPSSGIVDKAVDPSVL